MFGKDYSSCGMRISCRRWSERRLNHPAVFTRGDDGGGDSGDGEVSDSRDMLKSAGLGEGFYMVTEDKGDIRVSSQVLACANGSDWQWCHPRRQETRKKARFWKEDNKFSFGHIQIEDFFFSVKACSIECLFKILNWLFSVVFVLLIFLTSSSLTLEEMQSQVQTVAVYHVSASKYWCLPNLNLPGE